MSTSDSLLLRATARVGTTLKGKWRLDVVLGIGGMAAVYAATHRNQKRVAIKILHPEVALDEQVTTRFSREGYVANTVGHPGTVSVLDDDVTEDGAPFLVMELLEGQTLDALVTKRGPLPQAEVAALANQLLEVLAAAHEKGILHRDLKPENIFLTNDGVLKVLDFGIARLRQLSMRETVGTTRSGSLLGTPAFMAPEQARGRSDDVDERTDLWCAGATLYTLLSGRLVHDAETVNEQLIMAATQRAGSLAEVLPNAHPALARAIDRALSFEPAERWPNARAFGTAMRHALDMLDPSAAPAVLPGVRHNASETATPHGAVSSTVARADTITTGRPFMREVDLSSTSTALGRRGRWPVAVAAASVAGGAFLWWHASATSDQRSTTLENPANSSLVVLPSAAVGSGVIDPGGLTTRSAAGPFDPRPSASVGPSERAVQPPTVPSALFGQPAAAASALAVQPVTMPSGVAMPPGTGVQPVTMPTALAVQPLAMPSAEATLAAGRTAPPPVIKPNGRPGKPGSVGSKPNGARPGAPMVHPPAGTPATAPASPSDPFDRRH